MRSQREVARLARAIIVAALAAPAAFAQRPVPARSFVEPARRAAYFELVGAGGLYSLNVEHITPESKLWRLGVTAGGMTNYDNITNGENAIIGTFGQIVRVSFPGGEADSPIEIGGGVVLGKQWRHQSGSNRDEGAYAALVGNLGLRRKHSGPGLLWRLTFTPFLNFTAHNDNTDKGLQPSIGGSIGWVF